MASMMVVARDWKCKFESVMALAVSPVTVLATDEM